MYLWQHVVFLYDFQENVLSLHVKKMVKITQNNIILKILSKRDLCHVVMDVHLFKLIKCINKFND